MTKTIEIFLKIQKYLKNKQLLRVAASGFSIYQEGEEHMVYASAKKVEFSPIVTNFHKKKWLICYFVPGQSVNLETNGKIEYFSINKERYGSMGSVWKRCQQFTECGEH